MLALLAVGAAWLTGGRPAYTSLRDMLLSLCLVAATVAAYRYPIHLRHQTQTVMVTVVYYLTAVLLPPPLAAIVAGIGALAGEIAMRSIKGSYPSDIASEVGRRVTMVLLGGLVAQTMMHSGMVHVLALPVTCIALEALDFVTFPLVLAPMCSDRPLRIMVVTAREAYLYEGMQYVVGLLGALAAEQQIWALGLLSLPIALVYVAFRRLKEMHDQTRQLLESMADAVDLRDPYTGNHSRRVTDLCAGILHELQNHGPEVALILAAARVHDIGKIGIPDAVLNKPGTLTTEERALMEQHPAHAVTLLRRYPDFKRGVEIVLHHHESWDGRGYPAGLKGHEIPFGARVIAVADSFDAMTSDRPYRAGMPVEKAMSILCNGRGQQWDAAIVDAFLRSIDGGTARPMLTDGAARPMLTDGAARSASADGTPLSTAATDPTPPTTDIPAVA